MKSQLRSRILRSTVLFIFTVFCLLMAGQFNSNNISAQTKTDSTATGVPFSLSLNGNNASLSVAHSNSLSMTGEMTLEAWIKPNSTIGSQVIIDRMTQNLTSGSGGYQLRIDNGIVAFMICPDNLRIRCATTYSRTAIQPNQWQHIAAAFERGQTRIYLNGQIDGHRFKTTLPAGFAVGDMTIGASHRGLNRYQGLIDELRICNSAIYSSGFSATAQLTANQSTVGLWRFDNGTMNDSSSYNHQTTNIGMATFSPDVPVTPTFGFRYTETPNVGPKNELVDVVTVSPTNVWAVGSHGPADRCCFPKTPVSLNWDGTQWNSVPVPTVSGFQSFTLKSVDGNSSTDIWAIGDAFNINGNAQSFLMRWDGANWTFAATITPGTNNGTITSISVITDDDIWVVGSTADQRSLTIHWDGTSLTTVPSPNADSNGNPLKDVDAISSDEVWAVGDFMAIRWNGSVWQIVPGAPTNYAYLGSVSVVSPTDVWAIGGITTCGPFKSCSSRQFVLHYNGVSWAEVSIGNLEPIYTHLRSVSASDSANVWVVGSYGGKSLILRYNGSSFTRVLGEEGPILGASIAYDFLFSVSALNANEIWTVGNTSRIFYEPQYLNTVSNLALRGSFAP